jgi:hypothetical protein
MYVQYVFLYTGLERLASGIVTAEPAWTASVEKAAESDRERHFPFRRGRDRLGFQGSAVLRNGYCVQTGTANPSGILDIHTEDNTPMKNAIVKTLAISAAALLATGCVSTSEFNEHKAASDAAIKAAQQDAAAAKSAAESAAASASSAASAANSAQSTANQALQAAQGAQACCDATNEKIDRAFKKSMGK